MLSTYCILAAQRLAMTRLLLAFFALIGSLCVQAQLLSWTPPFPVENDAAQNLVITLDATKGNTGLLNYTPATDVYVHIGVITNLSANATDWKHVPFTWATTPALAQAVYVGGNKWQYTITGSLRTFFGLTNPAETIQKIAIIFRNGDGTKQQANKDASDMFVPIFTTNTLAVRFTQPLLEPLFVPAPETLTKNVGDNISITAITNKQATLKIYLNGALVQTAVNAISITANPVLATGGSQSITVEATDGVSTKSETISFFVAGGVGTAPLPAGVRQGINYESDGTAATLVLYAPGKTRVSVIGEFPGSNWIEQSAYQMNKTSDGNYWWLRLTGLTPGVEYAYQYLVDGTLKIADPYTQKILDPYNNNDQNISAATYPNLKPYPAGKTTGIVSLLQTKEPAYIWTNNSFNRPDKRGLVIYELLVRDFVATHDWKTVKDSLNYLKNLGINAIEVMPFNEFEGNNSWGYNPDFYFAPDKYYGPKNTLKEFIDACHSKGIAVIMDIALNHQFGLSPMVQLYFDALKGQPAANNPWFNQTPTHPFNVGYDMNHESLDTRYFTSRVVEHWLTEYKIDGFRFDLSKGFTQVNSGNDVSAWSNYDASRVAIWKRYYDTVQSKAPGAYVILEHFAANTEEKELSDYGMMLWGNANYSYNEASMGFVPTSDFSYGLATTRGWTKPHLVTYMESHDEERLMFKNEAYGNSSGTYNIKDTTTALKRIGLDAAFFLTLPGPKMIWQFGELGYDYSINYCENGTISPDCRLSPKPIRWDYLQQQRRKDLYQTFSSLIKLRFHPWYKEAFMSNRVDQSLSGAFKWIKLTTDTSNLLVVGNFDVTPTTGTITFQNSGTWYDYLANTPYTATGSPQTISLQPGEYHVYVNRNVGNATTTPVTNIPWNDNLLEARLFPNPVQDEVTVEMNVPKSGTVQIIVVNSIGQSAGKIYSNFLTKGKHLLPFHIADFGGKPGTYYLQIKTKEGSKTIPILIQ